jgi:hypothetical protein
VESLGNAEPSVTREGVFKTHFHRVQAAVHDGILGPENAMREFENTKVSVAASRMDLHRSSPYSVEITGPDMTATRIIGDQFTFELEGLTIEIDLYPALPAWISGPWVSSAQIDTVQPGLASF